MASQESTRPVETEEASTAQPAVYRLHLRPRPRVTFDEDVVDNEHLGRKKSNKCCIFHKKREFGESSSESGEDDSDDDGDGAKHHHGHDHRGRGCQHKKRPRRPKRAVSPSSSDEEQKSSA